MQQHKIAIIITSRIQGNSNHNLIKLLDTIQRYSKDVSRIEVLVKFDSDDQLVPQKQYAIEDHRYTFPIKFAMGIRGRGYIDIHYGYNQLLTMVDPSTTIIGAMADDFTVMQDWDEAVVKAAGNDDYFIIHQRPHPRSQWKSGRIGELAEDDPQFLMEENMFHSENLHIIDEAPLWSRKLLEAVSSPNFGMHTFPISFTDAWTITLEYVLWQDYKINITKFMDMIYINRYTSEVDQPGNPRWHTDRKMNFDFLKSDEYERIIMVQAGRVFDMIMKKEQEKAHAS